MRFWFSWPIGRGRRVGISGGPLAWLCLFYFYIAAVIVAAVIWVIVALVQLVFYGLRAVLRALFGKGRQ